MDFAAWLRQQIEFRRVSQRALAAAAGLSLGRIAAYVSGKSEPTLANARRLCRALGVGLGTLDRELAWDGEPAEKARPKK